MGLRRVASAGLQVVCVGLGLLGSLVALLLLLHGIAAPECSTDPDNPAAVRVLRVGLGLGAVALVTVPVALWRLRRRLAARWRWTAAVGWPLAVYLTLLASGGIVTVGLDLVDGSEQAANCF